MFMIAKAILYFSFAVLIGALILYTVPKEMRPEMKLAKRWLLVFLALIPIFGIGEIMRLTLYLGNDIGYWITFENIVTTFEVGKGWLFLTGISVLLFFMIFFNDVENERFFSILSLILLTGMAVSIGYSSHAASLSPIGLIPHTLHLLAVTIWSGVLLVTGFFSKGKAPGISFYRWFTPLAFVCLLTVIGAGLWLMSYIVPEYVNGYMLDYGQALLIKHVLLVVIVFYSVINGIWIKRKLKEDTGTFQPIKWIRVEGILLFAVFVATAVMSQQSPPHDVAETIKMEHPSKLFRFVTGLVPGNDPMLFFDMTMKSAGWFLSAILLLIAIFIGIKKNANMILVAIISFLAACTLYLTVMSSVSL
ncbi:copper resistance D family protein [Fictibacillus barbaricus]|uniref:Copper resistance protein D n=1 Tax=Fictibacillus barbaricus TaxID=182136 RepID=A0ABU1U0K4_9BACL|nr:CopD family protein [Fictibacillus barbaricus]MDR7072952.1 putative copper resistance protein D [Fictibacillus barbaricus]